MTSDNYRCPNCGEQLRSSPRSGEYKCKKCSIAVRETVAANQEILQNLANSDLSCSWIAEALLKSEKNGDEP